MNSTPRTDRTGLAFGLAAYGLWGMMPIYIHAIAGFPPMQMLAHRVVWCALLMLALVWLRRRPDLLADALKPRILFLLTISSILIALNWFAYILSVTSNQVTQASLGYFLNPLLSVLLGVFLLGERLRAVRWIALGLATTGLIYLMVIKQQMPWIALQISVSFSLYGLVRKLTPVDSLVGLLIETIILSPLALGMIIRWQREGTGVFGTDIGQDGLILLSGVVTAVPLLCFANAARRLPLTLMAFLQYISPSLQLLLAVLVYQERFEPEKQITFGLIWAGLGLFTLDSILTGRPASHEQMVQKENESIR